MYTIAADSVHLPIVCLEVGRLSSAHDDVLHVAPRQVAVGLEGQRADAGRQRSRGRRARVAGRARVVQIGRHDLVKRVKNKKKETPAVNSAVESNSTNVTAVRLTDRIV